MRTSAAQHFPQNFREKLLVAGKRIGSVFR